MHVHLDALGGAAGDMFAAALVDARPDWAEAVDAAVRALGLGNRVAARFTPHRDGMLRGTRFLVSSPAAPPATPAETVREWITRASLDRGVRARALDILALLTEAEAQVHGIPADAVLFHELGGLDTPVDLVAAAALIEVSGAASWSCGPLPRGRGRIRTEHGILPLPAPASAWLLEGMTLVDDGIEGERITPTGGAILRHLAPAQTGDFLPRRLCATGHGFGTSTFKGISNVLRAQLYDSPDKTPLSDRIAVLNFEVDDQSPEDLAVGIERVRNCDGVLSVTQQAVTSKHHRIAVLVQVLTRPDRISAVSAECFRETTTLGLRWTLMNRLVLPRTEVAVKGSAQPVRVKVAERPDGRRSAKAELADIRAAATGRDGRAELRTRVERQALDAAGTPPTGPEHEHDDA